MRKKAFSGQQCRPKYGERFAVFITIIAFCLIATGSVSHTDAAAPPKATAGLSPQPSVSMLVDDVRTSFAIQGKSIPPEIFRDLGDSDLADAKSSLVSVDVLAAVGSNRYADPITEAAGWRIQRSNKGEEFAYRFIGPAQNGLLIVVSRYNGGGSATFYMLHILDINAAKAFDAGGQVYDRVHVTTVQTIPLGDRWGGDVTLSGNAVRIKTTSAADGAGGNVRIVDVKRP